MRVRFPTPLKGWRVFAGEVGTIVLGVLLALGAQEMAQALHWRKEVRETRNALDAELSRDLAVFEFRYRQRGCVSQRVSELRKWIAARRNGNSVRLNGAIDEPPFFAIRTAAWEITDGEIASRIPIDAKLNYAALYDGMKRYDEMKIGEAEAWATLGEYETSGPLNDDDLRTVNRALADIDDTNLAIEAFKSAFDRFAGNLDIRPERNIESTAGSLMARWNRDFCKSLL